MSKAKFSPTRITALVAGATAIVAATAERKAAAGADRAVNAA
jgi:hypothetical protein